MSWLGTTLVWEDRKSPDPLIVVLLLIAFLSIFCIAFVSVVVVGLIVFCFNRSSVHTSCRAASAGLASSSKLLPSLTSHSYGQLDAVVVHHRARCTVVDIAAADTVVVDHVRPGLIVELVAAVNIHVLWERSYALVAAAAVVVAAAIVDDIVGSAGIAGSEEALVSERMAYSARVQYTIVDVPVIRQIQLMHLCELRAHQMVEPLLQNEPHILFREIVV